MTVRAAPSDVDVLAALAPAFGNRTIASMQRRPYRYATSFPLEEVELHLDDGSDATLIFKDLDWDRLLPEARRSKPRFLYEPRRSVETHRRILTPAGIGPRCYAAVADAEPPRAWLFLEKVPGVELWQIGELEAWESVATWLGQFHARFAGRVPELRATNPYLLAYDASWFELWRQRAGAALAETEDDRAAALGDVLTRYGEVTDALAALPTTLLHGEFYPSNVLVGPPGTEPRVCPIDWEMAATGTGLLDLAALVGGWEPGVRSRLVGAYCAGLEAVGTPARALVGTPADLERAELHLALQWLGWSRGWQAPPEHARDWIGDALALAGKLGL